MPCMLGFVADSLSALIANRVVLPKTRETPKATGQEFLDTHFWLGACASKGMQDSLQILSSLAGGQIHRPARAVLPMWQGGCDQLRAMVRT